MIKTRIHWGDGYVRITPTYPEELPQALRYWHKRLIWDEAIMRRVVTGSYRNLYTEAPFIDPDKRINNVLTTLPGFMHRVKELLEEHDYEYDIIDERTPFPEPDHLRGMAGLRDYQLECGYTATMSGGGIVACPTGWGKTHIMASIIGSFPHQELCYRNTPQVVVAAGEKDIAAQNYEALCDLLPDRDVGLIMSGKQKVSDDIQVITLSSMHKLKPLEVGIFISDEVHTTATDARSEIIMAMSKARKWGLSATPDGRFDGGDLLTEGLFGPVVYRRSYAQGVEDGALVPIKTYWLRVPEPHIGMTKYRRYKTRQGKYNWGVEKNTNQTEMIARVLANTPDDMQVLCIMQHLLQMNQIKEVVPEVEIVHGQTSGDQILKDHLYNLTAISAKERRRIYADFRAGKLKKVLSTYVYKQGVNFPGLNVLVCAGGGGSAIAAGQIPGRASRNIPGKDGAYLIDFWHDWDTVTGDRGRQKPGYILKDDRERDRVYESLGFERHWVDSVFDLPFVEEV